MQIARRRRGMPFDTEYPCVPGRWLTSTSFSTMCAGVGPSGLPMLRSTMSSPRRRAAVFNSPVIANSKAAAARCVESQSEHELLGGRPQVVMRANRVTVGAGIGDQENISLGGARQQAIVSQHVTALADGADHGANEVRRLAKTRQANNFVIRAVAPTAALNSCQSRLPDIVHGLAMESIVTGD